MPTVSGASVVEDGERTRFVVEIDRPVEFNVFALADPYRVIIDMKEVHFALPAEAGDEGEGLVKAFRFGLFSAGRSRVVIDASGPVEMAKPEILESDGGGPAQLVVELTETSREKFLKEIALNGSQSREAVAPPAIRTTIAPPRMAKPTDEPVVVIDPGHGGIDPGARGGSGALEKDIVLTFSQTLAERLRAGGKLKVLMTRTDDTFVSLQDRRAFAEKHHASLFISVHADSIRRSGISGATVYTVSPKASDEEAAALAAQENRSDAIAGVTLEEYADEVGDILIDLRMRETKNESRHFAKTLVNSMRNEVRLNRNPHRSAGFVVLKQTNVPSVLLELGYLSNERDVEAMRSEDWRIKVSDAIASAVNRFVTARFAGTN